jgi:twitching motility protein PilT
MTAVHSIDQLLEGMETLRASDLHISAGSPPVARVRGEMTVLEELPELTPDDCSSSSTASSTERHGSRSTNRSLVRDLRRPLPRQHLLPAKRSAAVFRLIPHRILTLEPGSRAMHEFAERPRGLVLVTGPTGSGKSTTLAAMIDEINRNRAGHILTIEDPIEFLHSHRRCLVNQREVGTDARGFAEALRAGLRQDPDVILLGEMRDLETISTAPTAAETGHLVFATLHTGRPARSTASSMSSPPSSRARSAPSSRPASKASSPRRCCRRPTARAASPPSRS